MSRLTKKHTCYKCPVCEKTSDGGLNPLHFSTSSTSLFGKVCTLDPRLCVKTLHSVRLKCHPTVSNIVGSPEEIRCRWSVPAAARGNPPSKKCQIYFSKRPSTQLPPPSSPSTSLYTAARNSQVFAPYPAHKTAPFLFLLSFFLEEKKKHTH